MIVHLEKDPGTSTIRYSDYTNWDDLRFPAVGINPVGGASDPDRDLTDGTFLFDDASTEVITGMAQMPHAWKEGSLIDAHIHWQPSDTGAGNVYWRFEYKVANINSNFPASFIVANTQAATELVATKHQFHQLVQIDMTGYTISSIIKWKLSRIGGDALDTYASDVKLLELDFHYQIGSVGSGQEYTK